MSQRTFLGLTHNPFVPPKEGFFSGADRKTHLEHLRHLSQWSRRILVVSGPFGIGKSTLFRELSSNLEPHTKAARLAGTVVTTEREVLSALLQGFGVAADSSAVAEDLATVIAKFVDEQEDSGRSCMVMVDDGHLLEPSALQRLIKLVAGSSLRMVVFAETTVIGAIDRDTKAASLEWFEIRLTGFPKSDVRDYLEWRFSQAQYRGLLPFTDEQLETIVTKSSGNPGVVDSLASNLLIEMETGQIRNRGAGFPFMHGVLAVLLVAFVGLLYVWFQRSAEEDPVSSERPAVVHEGDQVAPASSGDVQLAAASESASTPDESAVRVDVQTEEVQPQAEAERPDADPDETGGAKDDWIKEEFGGVSPNPGWGAVEKESRPSPRSEPPTEEQAPVTDAVATSAEAEEPAVTQPDTQDEIIPIRESTPSSQAPEATMEDANGIKNARWLLDQDPRRFTVQLVTVSKPERARELIGEQADPGSFAVYQINRDGRRLNVITFGIFSTSAAASSAAGELQGQLATVKPWVRPLNLVQDAVRAGL